MAAATQIPKPPANEIVTPDVLKIFSYGMGLSHLTRGFGGMRDPSVIWDSMMHNRPESFEYYAELEEKDDDIGGLLETLKLAVLGRKRKVDPADDSSQAQDVAKFIGNQLDAIPDFHGAMHALLDGPAYGLSVAEINYDLSGGQVAVAAINDCPQEMFGFAEQRYLPQIGPLRFFPQIYSVAGGTEVPEQKFLVFSYNERKRNRFGRPLLRRAFWPSWFKRNALRFWLRFAEKGPGTAAVRYAAGASDDEKQKALEAAEAIIEKVAIAIPESFALETELLTTARAQNPSVYERLVQRNELAIARAILGETLTSHGSDQGSGSYALGQVHQEMFHQREIELARALESVINRQLVRNLVIWNFGPDAPMPKWCIDTGDPEDLAVRIRIDAALQSMGLPITQNYLQTVYGIPEPQATDKVVQPAAISSSATAPLRPITPPMPPDLSTAFGEADVRRELKDVDRLAGQFRSEALNVYRERVAQLAQQIAVNGGAR